ncbi:MAG: VgrG-related protein [Elainellaceae cyanobacterium]
MLQNLIEPSGNYQALPHIEIDGETDPPEIMDALLQVVVEESLHLPAMFLLTIRNDYAPGKSNDQAWKHKDIVEIGKEIKIGLSSSTASSEDFDQENSGQLIEGEITAIETHFTEQTQAPITLRGYDVSHRLHRGRHNRSFQNMTDSDILKKVVQEVGIDLGTVDESGVPHDYVFQENQTNMEFLRERASRIGFELFVEDGKLNFRKPSSDNTLELKWLRDIRSFRVRVSSAEQVKEVEVRGWDYTAKRPIISTAQREKLLTETDNGRGSALSSEFDGQPSDPKMIIVDQPVFQPKEADLIAEALCNELGGVFIYADARAEGNPNIRPGRIIELEDMGPHNGKYYVTETRHIYTERVYTTEFSVRGLRCGDLLSTLAPSRRLQPGQTFLVGIVTDNEDPDNMGRVKVKFPTLTEDHASNWARVVSMGAGSKRGFDCLPEIDDEVLVAFEHGDIHRPYILGGVWNGQDAPPNSPTDNVQDGKVRLRTLQTRTGHKLQFVEEDASTKAGIYVETTGGHKIRLNDSEQMIQLQTAGGHTLTLSDASGSITIQSTGNMTLSAPGNLDISAAAISAMAAGGLTLQGGNVTVLGGSVIVQGGAVALQGGVISLN